MDSVRRASGTLTAEGTANAADLLGIGSQSQPKPTNASASSSGPRAAIGMLPTPAKTPRKQPDGITEANVRSVARNLFAAEAEPIPTPRKRKSKKYTGLTLDSFRAENIDEPIEIFTDSRDRVPEKDTTTENPFYATTSTDAPAPAPAPEPTKRRSPRKHVTIPGEGRATIEEAIQREDGIIYVFRGKKIFRKFSHKFDDSSIGEPDADEEEIADPPSPSRRITRSSIKPRLLFPRAGKGKAIEHTSNEDEEAATDIEDHVLNAGADADVASPATPLDLVDEKPGTPKAPRFAPASPPSTSRTTRVSSKLSAAESTSMKKPTKARSPFDGWRRSKRAAESHGQKREGSPLSRPDEASKRQRA
ncbi:hypothetical protein SLS62_005746 [Diatrype stigma]|uniref:Uncharacterized protein n=1 Tax=Diatrype stigma TaxID=117547 RepID=A0AAN9URU8_9PEZI